MKGTSGCTRRAGFATILAANSTIRSSTTSPRTGPGERLITDYWHPDGRTLLYVADLGEPGRDPARNFRCLLNSRASRDKNAHTHPFLSPDGTRAFFNSDETGLMQAYMVEGF